MSRQETAVTERDAGHRIMSEPVSGQIFIYLAMASEAVNIRNRQCHACLPSWPRVRRRGKSNLGQTALLKTKSGLIIVKGKVNDRQDCVFPNPSKANAMVALTDLQEAYTIPNWFGWIYRNRVNQAISYHDE